MTTLTPPQTSSQHAAPHQKCVDEDRVVERTENPTTTAEGHKDGDSWLREMWTIALEQWFLIALGLLIAFSSQIQVPLSQQKTKQMITSYLCISLIFLVTGCTLDTRALLANSSRWKIHLFVQLQCYIMTSLVVLAVVSATATSRFMDPALLVGLLFQSCVATTISSNVVMTKQAHGNTALTVVQTTLGNFLGVFITPALVVGYTAIPTRYNAVLPTNSNDFTPIYRRTLMKLGLSVYLPFVVGQMVRNVFPKTCNKIFASWRLNKLGSLCLLVLLWSTYDQAFASHAFDTVPASNKVFIVFISVALWILFFAIAFFTSNVWLPRKDTVAVCYCVPAKGIVMAVPLTTTIWTGLDLDVESRLQIPIVIYQGLQLAFASILVPVFRRWIDAEDERMRNAAEADARDNHQESVRTDDSKG